VASGHLGIVKFLVSKGANVYTRNNKAIRLAAKYGHLEIVKYLAKKI